MKAYNLDQKTFVATANEHGLSSGETLFHYFQEGEVITGRYGGGPIKAGVLVGRQTGPDQVQLLFQCLTTGNELKAGQSTGIITEAAGGKLRLNFVWNWLNGDGAGGLSSYREVT